MLDAEELSHDVEDEERVERKLRGIARQRLTSLEGHLELLKQINGNFLRKKRLSTKRLHLGLVVKGVET